MFGSFPSRRRPIKAQSVWLPAPTHPLVGQQQYGDGSVGTLKSGFSVIGHLEGKEWFLGCHHTRTHKSKNPRLILLFPPDASYELLGSEGWLNLPLIVSAVAPPLTQQGSWESGSWPCLRGASMLSQTVLPSGKQPVQAAFWDRDSHCRVSPWLPTHGAMRYCFFRYILIWPVVFLLTGDPLSWRGAGSEKGQCLAAFRAKGNRPGLTSLVWFYLSAKWVWLKYLVSIYTINNLEPEPGKSVNKPNNPFWGNGTEQQSTVVSGWCPVNVSWIRNWYDKARKGALSTKWL